MPKIESFSKQIIQVDLVIRGLLWEKSLISNTDFSNLETAFLETSFSNLTLNS